MRHILHFIHHDGAGGGPKVVRQLISGLTEFRHTFVHGGRGDLHAWCEERGVPSVEVEADSAVGALAGIPCLASAFRRAAPDVILLHGQWAGPVGALAARQAGVGRVAYVAHCPAFYHSTSLFRSVRNYVAERIPCRVADRVVTLSKGSHYGYLYRGWADEKKLVYIANGLDPMDIPDPGEVSKLRWEWSWAEDKVHVVFAGRLDDQKRVDWLLEAWAMEPELARKAVLWIVGDGRDRDMLEELAGRLGRGDAIRFVGAQASAMAWIAAADIVVMSSLYEGHALVPLEAMACGKPVAAFATHGVTDSVVHGETGLLAQLGDRRALAEAISRLVDDAALRAAFGAAGRHRLVSTFPLSKTFDGYRALIADLLAFD